MNCGRIRRQALDAVRSLSLRLFRPCRASPSRAATADSRSIALAAFLTIPTAPALAQVDVSATGSAGYTHAISVPPGVSGISPKLSLSYGGGNMNSAVGLGWSIQGLSAITRCPGTRATDGAPGRVAYAPSDKLCLDGQRLIQTDASGAPAATQTDDSLGVNSGVREFRTEKDTYVRVRAYGIAGGSNAGNGPAYFRVWSKSGLVYEYGASPAADANTNSLILAADGGVATTWAVTRISDTAGNYMDFKYEQRSVAWGSGPAGSPVAGREWNILEIQYTGRSGQAPTNKAIFSYADRSNDRSEFYHQGFKTVSVRLLQSITTYVNSPNPSTLGSGPNAVAVRTVRLTYDTAPITRRSRVTAITECAGGVTSTTCLPATTFTYRPGGNEQFTANTAFRNSSLSTLAMHSTTGNVGVLTGDFNGDGRTDILRWSDTPSQNQLWLSNGDGTFAQATNFNITDQNIFKSDACYASMAADFNGDGLPDIFRYSNATDAAGNACSSYGVNHIYFSRGDGTFTGTTVTSPTLERRTSKVTTKCGSANCTIEPLWINTWNAGSTFYFMDVDADGRLDIVTTTIPAATIDRDAPPPDPCTVCTRVYRGNGDGTFTEIPTNVANRSLYSGPPGGYSLVAPTKLADFDGDGLLDLQGLTKRYSNSAVAYRSRGDGNFDPVSGATECLLVLDFNGDQRQDCLAPPSLMYSNGLPTQQQTGNFNLGNEELFVISPTTFKNTSSSIIADINGDGLQDILRWKDDPTQNAVFLSNGDGTFTQSTSFNLNTADTALQHSNDETGVIPGDFTGRGFVEFLRVKNAPSATSEATRNQLYAKVDTTPSDQLASVRSGTGALASLSYLPLSNSSSALGPRYQSDRDANNTPIYPRVHVLAPMYVVTTVQNDTGVGSGVVNTEYSYRGLKFDLTGRGGLGFREVRRQSTGANGDLLTTFTHYLQAHPFVGIAARNETRRGTVNEMSAPLLSTTSHIYCDKTAPAGSESGASEAAPCTTTAKVQRPYLYRTTETGSDLNGATLPTVTTTNTFNVAGDPETITVSTTGSVAGIAQTHTKVTTSSYYPDNTSADNWILGRLQRASVRSIVPNSFASIAASAGTASNATATSGTKDPLTVVISPSPVEKTQTSAGVVSQVVTASVGAYPTPPITYEWVRIGGSTSLITASPATGTSNQTTLSASLAAGQTATETWQVTVRDAAGRTKSESVGVTLRVTAPSAPTVSANPSPLTISSSTRGTVSGNITATGAGGTPPYSYAWSRVTGSRISFSGAQTGTFSTNVTYGDNFTEQFRVTVTDANSLTGSVVVNVNAIGPAMPPALAISGVSPGSPSGSRNNPGSASTSATVSTTGGAAPIAYSWTRVSGSRINVSGANTPTATFSASLGWSENLSETFRIEVTDDALQTAAQNVTVTFTTPAAPDVSISPGALTITNGSPGTASGSATASGSGGVPPYNYAWSRLTGSAISVSGGQTGSFSAGVTWNSNFTESFQVTMTDAAGNTATRPLNVTALGPTPPALTIALPSTLTQYGGGLTVTASTTVTVSSGGTGGLSFNWAKLSGDSISVSGGQSVTFSGNPPPRPTNCEEMIPIVAVFRVTVTDSIGQVRTADITVELYTTRYGMHVPECPVG